MRVMGLSIAILAACAMPAMGAVGDQWILGIHHIDNQGSFTTYPGAGYSGPQSSGHANFLGNAYGRGGPDGQARVYWELSGNSIDTNRPVPTTAEQYTIEFFGTSAPANNDWQPIESQYHGVGGEGGHGIPPWNAPGNTSLSPLYDEHIPWNGAFSSNHQYIAADAKIPGQWRPTGPGPHTPDSAALGAGPNGLYMWLTSGSWLYAKWDFGFSINRSWSAIRLTQVTGDAPPPPPEGDYNKNGTVDAADYVIWRKGVYPDADGFEDGIIDEYDYFVWLDNFGEPSSGAGGGQVPEPASVALALLSLLGIAFASRRRD
jgi:hypothetical protein